jgi:hypothetical protein
MLLVLASAVFLGSETPGTVSYLRLPVSSPPTARKVTVEVFEPASTRAAHDDWSLVEVALLYHGLGLNKEHLVEKLFSPAAMQRKYAPNNLFVTVETPL